MSNRAPNLTTERVDAICEVIRGMSGRVSWPAVIKAVAASMGARYTRQALFQHERIRVAVAAAKGAADKPATSRQRPMSAEMQAVVERLRRVERENQECRMLNERLMGKFVRWAYNASLRGITEAQLDEALPPVDRNGG